MSFGTCDRCSSDDRVELYHHMAPSWDTEFLCWPCRKPLVYQRVFPERLTSDENPAAPRPESGQASLFDY